MFACATLAAATLSLSTAGPADGIDGKQKEVIPIRTQESFIVTCVCVSLSLSELCARTCVCVFDLVLEFVMC